MRCWFGSDAWRLRRPLVLLRAAPLGVNEIPDYHTLFQRLAEGLSPAWALSRNHGPKVCGRLRLYTVDRTGLRTAGCGAARQIDYCDEGGLRRAN